MQASADPSKTERLVRRAIDTRPFRSTKFEFLVPVGMERRMFVFIACHN